MCTHIMNNGIAGASRGETATVGGSTVLQCLLEFSYYLLQLYIGALFHHRKQSCRTHRVSTGADILIDDGQTITSTSLDVMSGWFLMLV